MLSFETTEKLLSHVLHHVLTPEEAHAWYFIWRETDERLAPTPAGVDCCFRLRNRLTQDEEVCQSLTMHYLETIAEQIAESRQLQWTAETDWRQVGFSLSGVYYVLAKDAARNETIVTAFVPGFGASAGTRHSQESPDDPHARTHCPSWTRGERDDRQKDRSEPAIAKRLLERRAATWSSDQRLYFLVFRPAVQFLRGWQDWKRPNRLGMSSLPAKLPPMSQLKLESWMELRTQRGGSHQDG